MYIYSITNLINNKKYIGQTIQKNTQRWAEHQSSCRSNSIYIIHCAIRKYGVENFQFEIIDESASDIDELNDLEEFYISYYDTFKGQGYNCTSGGDNALHTKETIEKIRQSKLGKKHTEESKRKISEALSGNSLTKFTKNKISKTLLSKNKTGIQSTSSKKVMQIDKHTGQELCCWFSIGEVMRMLGIIDTNISQCCKKKRGFNTAGGYKWEYIFIDDK